MELALIPSLCAFCWLCCTCCCSWAATALAANSGETWVGDWKDTEGSFDRSWYFLDAQVLHSFGPILGFFSAATAAGVPALLVWLAGRTESWERSDRSWLFWRPLSWIADIIDSSLWHDFPRASFVSVHDVQSSPS